MKLVLIAAVASNRGIGYRNHLLYHLPEDMAHFKSLTIGHTVIMGRITYESLPHGALSKRKNIVLTSSLESQAHSSVYDNGETSLEFFSSLEEALATCAKEETVYVIGGARLYEQAIGIADELCLTEIEDTPCAVDAWFPDYHEWKEIIREDYPKSPSHQYAFSFVTYRR